MCTSWTAEQWEANSQPATASSPYTMEDTRYSQSGQFARTYSYASGSGWYAVFPGYGNHPSFYTRSEALDYMATQGYNLAEKPVAIGNATEPELLGFADLVENFA